jgi:hypothetical protein
MPNKIFAPSKESDATPPKPRKAAGRHGCDQRRVWRAGPPALVVAGGWWQPSCGRLWLCVGPGGDDGDSAEPGLAAR